MANPARQPGLTPEQTGSTVRVRIVAGALPPKSYVGALLHRDEVATVPGMQGRSRCVLALLPGWKGEQLRSPQCKISIQRNQPGEQNPGSAMSRTARLLQFDDQTGLAAFGYAETIDAIVDVGYHLERAAMVPGSTRAVRTTVGEAPAGPTPRGYERTPSILLFQSGVFTSQGGSEGTVQFPPEPPNADPDESPALISGKDKLVGFLILPEGAGKASLVSIRGFALDRKIPRLDLLGIAFGSLNNQEVPIVIKLKPADLKLHPRGATLRRAEGPNVTAPDPTERAVYEPIETKMIQSISSINERDWRATLPAPRNDGTESVYLLQLGWSPGSDEFSQPIFSRPFLVKLQNKNGTVVPSVVGLANLNERAPQGESTSFDVESPIRDFHELAGGREVLFQLEKAPYWMRFSLTRNEWLPLPPVNLSNVYVTGNLSALFILDRDAAEVRKYRRDTLEPVATAKLPANEEYVAVLAGCNTDRGPVHVLTRRNAVSLSPETLQRRDRLGMRNPRGEDYPINATVDSNFDITGDGLSLQPYRDRRDGSRIRHYVSDALGATLKFFDGILWSGESAGVSCALVSRADSWLTTLATPDGTIFTPKAPPTWKPDYPHWLVPTSPSVFQYVPGNARAIPPRPGRI